MKSGNYKRGRQKKKKTKISFLVSNCPSKPVEEEESKERRKKRKRNEEEKKKIKVCLS